MEGTSLAILPDNIKKIYNNEKLTEKFLSVYDVTEIIKEQTDEQFYKEAEQY